MTEEIERRYVLGVKIGADNLDRLVYEINRIGYLLERYRKIWIPDTETYRAALMLGQLRC